MIRPSSPCAACKARAGSGRQSPGEDGDACFIFERWIGILGRVSDSPESSDDTVQPRGGFTWPPRGVPTGSDQPGVPSATAPVSVPGTRQIDPATDDAASSRPAVRGPAGTGRETLNSGTRRRGPGPRHVFERTWLGLTSPPWATRAAEAGFQPDRPEVYCPRCAGPVGAGETGFEVSREGCATCSQERLPWARAVRLGAFGGVLREAILEAKYARWRRLAFDLGCDLGEAIGLALAAAGIDAAAAAIVPVPMSFRRRWSRGLDHTLAIARGVQERTGARIVRALGRRHRPVQASLPESVREANARGSFTPRGGQPLGTYEAIVVVDDVRTTGATLRAACRAVGSRERAMGGRLQSDCVWVAALAVVTPRERREPAGEVRKIEAE